MVNSCAYAPARLRADAEYTVPSDDFVCGLEFRRPCGHCLQFCHELKDVDSLVFLSANDEQYEKRITDLLPFGMRPKALCCLVEENRGASIHRSQQSMTIFSGRAHVELSELEKIEVEECIANAGPRDGTSSLRAAFERSHCPYSGPKQRAAIALVCDLAEEGGERVFVGSSIESVAFNPTMSPLQCAFVNLSAARRDTNVSVESLLNSITRVVLLEYNGTESSWKTRVEGFFREILPHRYVSVQRIGLGARSA